jgi:hypothetical protein
MNDHWQAGYEDAVRALSHKEIFERPNIKQGFRAFDFTERGDEEKHRELSSTDMVTPTLVAAATSTGK